MRALVYRDRRVRSGGAILGAAAGLLTEPVFRTMYLGQINLLLMALIIWDLGQPDSRWWKGIATGLAAGIKLVPLIFIPYLLLIRKFRQAAVAFGSFVGTVLPGFVILPGDLPGLVAARPVHQDGRTGFVGWGGNQSTRHRHQAGGQHPVRATVIWVVAVLVTVLGLICAAMLDGPGTMLGLLMVVSSGCSTRRSAGTIWVWVVPGMMVAVHYAVRAWQAGRRRGAVGCAALAVAMLLVFAPWPGNLWGVHTTGPGNFTHGLIWAAPNTPVTKYVLYGDQPWFLEYHWNGLQVFAGNAYILAGLVLLVILGFTAILTSGSAKAPASAQVGPAEPISA
jgi:alpha-1,2-mannosyltransferase